MLVSFIKSLNKKINNDSDTALMKSIKYNYKNTYE